MAFKVRDMILSAPCLIERLRAMTLGAGLERVQPLVIACVSRGAYPAATRPLAAQPREGDVTRVRFRCRVRGLLETI